MTLLSEYRPTTEESPTILNNGEWVRKGLVLVWQESELPPEPEPTNLDGLEFVELVVCSQCGATASEHCLSASGLRAKPPHSVRTIRRTCPCLAPLGHNHRYCTPCRTRNDAARKKRYETRVREAA